MKGKNRTPPVKPLARERIAVLFSEAENVYREHPEYSDRYVALARKIAMRQRVRIDREHRRRSLPPLLPVPGARRQHAGADPPWMGGSHLP